MLLTASSAILGALASTQRRVLADWRALVILRRATFATVKTDRRWSHLPRYPEDVTPYLRQMRRRGEIEPIPGLGRIYLVTVPYARFGPVSELEILFEVNPYAVLSHLSALVFHGLTNETPNSISAMSPARSSQDVIPLDTEPLDWEGVELPNVRMPTTLLKRPVSWTRVRPERFFGFTTYQSAGFTMRVTTPERTLLDALQEPSLCGGVENVLRAWATSRDTLRLDSVVQLVDRYDVAILRQRVGYILDELRLDHPELARWRAAAHRGGSSKLVGSAPFETVHSERWNLSLNGPVWVLTDDAA